MWSYDKRQLEDKRPLSKKGVEDLKLLFWILFLIAAAAVFALIK